ncbi:MAG: peptidoglycan editing factor PgeF [Rhodobacteraceae bacterium]|nr:peptidoglycan editing factor PgeF [Paracoccaceae bacterium]
MTLEILKADELAPFRHGFFTRLGGVSSGIFAGLNCGPGSSDQTDIVRTNRRLVVQELGIGADDLATLHQVHSADVLTLTAAPDTPRPRADAMVSRRPGLGLGILTADCQPVLFGDAEAGVVGAAHAGWKGALDGVLEATVEAMVALGAERGRINAVIGPTISQSAYEVGPEFRNRFLAADPDNTAYFTAGTGDHAYFDLPAYGLARLRCAGVGSARWTGHCTYGDAGRFYSYRRTTHAGEADYGRLISVIVA